MLMERTQDSGNESLDELDALYSQLDELYLNCRLCPWGLKEKLVELEERLSIPEEIKDKIGEESYKSTKDNLVKLISIYRKRIHFLEGRAASRDGALTKGVRREIDERRNQSRSVRTLKKRSYLGKSNLEIECLIIILN